MRIRARHKEKMISLRKQLMRFLAAAWILIACLLFLVFVVSSKSRFEKNAEQVQRRAEDFAGELESGITQLKKSMGRIYTYDTGLQGLYDDAAGNSFTSSVYAMKQYLEIQNNLQEDSTAFFVFYGTDQIPLYTVSEEISFQDIEYLKHAAQTVRDYVKNQEEVIIEAVDAVYYCILQDSGSHLFMGCIQMDSILPYERNSSETYQIVYANRVYTIGSHGSGSDMTLDLNEMTEGLHYENGTIEAFSFVSGQDLCTVVTASDTFSIHFGIFQISLLILFIAEQIFFFCLYRFYQKEMVAPLEDMTRAMKSIRKGSYEVSFQTPNHLIEIEHVRNAIQTMLREIEHYKIEAYENAIESQKTQLRFRTLQLAPHFYTNCLKNLYCMLEMEEYDNAMQFVLKLSRHIRYILNDKANLTELSNEVGFVRNYVEMMELLNDREIDFGLEMEEGTENCLVPVLLIQTFVENTVKYAKIPRRGKLEIRVQIQKAPPGEQPGLEIIVQDNGTGYPEETLKELNAQGMEVQTDSDQTKQGIGIRNLMERCRLLYETPCRFRFLNNEKGARSEVWVPIHGTNKESE